MKADFFAADELEEVVRWQANGWKSLSLTKKSKMTDFLSKDVQKIKSKVANESLPTISQETTESVTINDKINRRQKHLLLSPILQLLRLLKRKLNKKSSLKTRY